MRRVSRRFSSLRRRRVTRKQGEREENACALAPVRVTRDSVQGEREEFSRAESLDEKKRSPSHLIAEGELFRRRRSVRRVPRRFSSLSPKALSRGGLSARDLVRRDENRERSASLLFRRRRTLSPKALCAPSSSALLFSFAEGALSRRSLGEGKISKRKYWVCIPGISRAWFYLYSY